VNKTLNKGGLGERRRGRGKTTDKLKRGKRTTEPGIPNSQSREDPTWKSGFVQQKNRNTRGQKGKRTQSHKTLGKTPLRQKGRREGWVIGAKKAASVRKTRGQETENREISTMVGRFLGKN